MKAKDRTNHKPAPRSDRHRPYLSHRGELVDRTCLGLGCGITFTAHRFGYRLCENCRKKDH